MKRFSLICLATTLAMTAVGIAVPPQETPAANYEALARGILSDLVARQFDKVAARYDARMTQALPVDKLAASWDGLITQVGTFQSITLIEQEEAGSSHLVYATCAFEKTSLIFRLAFNAQGQFAGFTVVPASARIPWKAPDYAKPDSFQERQIVVHSGHFDLPGTLTLPKGPGPFPAVVLVHGSGPNDQDESVGACKVFKDLAWGLASRAIAVLRYTKRTRQYGAKSSDDLSTFTVKDETIDDAQAAVALAAATPGINPKRIFIIGHSLGAYVGPRIAAGDPQIAGLVLMAGNTRPMEDLLVEQIRYLATLNGPVTPEAQKQIDAAEASAKEFRNPELKPGMTVHLLGAEVPASYVLDLRSYHPVEAAAALKIPIYILQGGRDYQVRVADFEGWKKGLSGKPNVHFKLYPDLNHLFVFGAGPSSNLEYIKPGHVSEEVISDIAAWIVAQGGGAK